MQIYHDLCFKEFREFILYEETVKSASVNTVYSYYRDLMQFFRYMKYIKGRVSPAVSFEDILVNDLDLEFVKNITGDDISRYFCYLTEIRNNSAKTRARKLTSLREFFKYMHIVRNLTESDPSEALQMPKLPKPSLNYMNEEECIKLLDSINGENKERDYCILVIFLNCGLRLSELIKLNDTDIDQFGNVTIRGSGNKTRKLLMNSACLEAIDEYAQYKQEFFKGKSYDHHAIFVGRHGKRLTARWIEEIVSKRMKDAGFEGRGLSPHKLRHTAAKVMFKRGVDVKVLQQILGHENLNATQIYTEVSEQQVKDAMKNALFERSKPNNTNKNQNNITDENKK